MLSGKDEQPISDFPVCPKCGGRDSLRFWRGYRAGCVVLFDCVGYKGITKPRVLQGKALGLLGASLEHVNSVTCILCGNCDEKASDILFDQIIKVGRKLVVGEG